MKYVDRSVQSNELQVSLLSSTKSAPQTALVTGATSGIGRAIALKLAEDGFHVVVHGRNAERGAATVKEIQSGGGTARFVGADLAEPTGIRTLIAEAGEVDVLVNNAGAGWFGPTADLDFAAFDAQIASNFRAPYFLVAALAPKMAERGHGSIISIGSMAGSFGLNGAAVYGGTKAAIQNMTKAWAAEFSPSGVRVNTVAPGPIYTEGTDDAFIEHLGNTTPLNRAGQPQEVAEIVAFLASPKSRYITGASLAVDGGRTAV
ncbi:SDR family NAD(P)-dependent oxidoreductase [Streptomyces mirabilis]|uniref:SDR family NAD(P)-dependent oxidoreductase n=1 Tax=Streptomyces mirabilis TaxID=68239 RepID=UPI0036A1AE03